MSILATGELYGGELHCLLYERAKVVQGAGMWVYFVLRWNTTEYKADTWFTARFYDLRA